MARYLAQRRRRANVVTIPELLQGKERMLKIIADGDDCDAATAFHGLLRLRRMAQTLAAEDDEAPIGESPSSPSPSPNEESQGALSSSLPVGEGRGGASPQNSHENYDHLFDYEDETADEDFIAETDTLPNGQPAFGLAITPIKADKAAPAPEKPIAPIRIEFISWRTGKPYPFGEPDPDGPCPEDEDWRCNPGESEPLAMRTKEYKALMADPSRRAEIFPPDDPNSYRHLKPDGDEETI